MSTRPAPPWSNGQTYIERGVRYVYRSAIGKWRVQNVSPSEIAIAASQVDFTPAGSIAATQVQAAIEETASEGIAALAAHTSNVSNPHSVTKAQVGLGSADNTSDLNKPISTATQAALDGKQAALGFTPENVANKGQANGYASLDGAGKVPATQLPSYVDDVLEYANLAAFPGTGETGKIYVAIDTGKAHRWSGSAYVEISPSPGSTDAVPEGSVNLYHTTGRAAAAAPVQSVAGRTGAVTLTKSDVGLGNVDNTADASKSFVATQISNSTTVGRDVLTAASQAAARTAIGVGAGTGDLVAANNLSELTATAGAVRTNLGLAIGTHVQAYDADLQQIAGFTPTKGHVIVGDGSAWQVVSVGADGTALVASAAASAGVVWGAPTVTAPENLFNFVTFH